MPNLNEYLKAYKRLIPLKGKRATLKGWPKLPFEKCLQQTEYPNNFGWALDDSDLVLDVDPRNGGMDGIEKLSNDCGIDLVEATNVRAISGDSGLHLIFKKDPEFPVKYKLPAYKGIEVLSFGSYIVGVGSIHPDTKKPYMWDYTFESLNDAPEVPEALLSIVERAEVAEQSGLENYDDSENTQSRYLDYLEGVGPCFMQDDVSSYILSLRGRDLGLSPLKTLDCLCKWDEENNPKWGRDTLYSKVVHAYRYGKSPKGSANPRAVFEESAPEPEAKPTPIDENIDELVSYGKNAPENARLYLSREYPCDGLRYRYGLYYAYDYDQGIWECIDNKTLQHQIQGAMEYSGVSQNAINSTITAVDRKVYGINFKFDETKIAFADGILDLKHPESPVVHEFDIKHQVCGKHPFPYSLKGKCDQWLRFLDEIFEGDQERVDLLQEWFGYNLVPPTDHQKIMVFVGASRAGKGIISRVLRSVVRPENFAGISLSSLVNDFGLSMLVGKKTAVIADAHGVSRGQQGRAKEILLNISGGDYVAVNRKRESFLSLKLPTKLTLVANEVPSFSDGSDALANRYLILPFRKSFANEEDPFLERRLLGELQGILGWAVEGLKRLCIQGRFSSVLSAKEELAEIKAANNPVAEFIKEYIRFDKKGTVEVHEVYDVYLEYCRDFGRAPMSSHRFASLFYRNLLSYGIKKSQSRGGGKRTYVFEGIKLEKDQPFHVIDGGWVAEQKG
jgi:P4 family phage/plasmid primase-like protien